MDDEPQPSRNLHEHYAFINTAPALSGSLPPFTPARLKSSFDDKKGAKIARDAARSGFEECVGRIGKLDLIYVVKAGGRKREAVVSIAALHKMTVYALQKALVREASTIQSTGRMSENRATRVGRLIREYCLGYDDDPFILRTSKQLNVRLLEEENIIPDYVSLSELEEARDKDRPTLPFGYRNKMQQKTKAEAFVRRFIAAVGGGIALIAPMQLMVLRRDLLTSLLTVSVSVLVFAIVGAIFSDGTPWELLTATAAYAAVLVVFVGTSS